MQLCAALFEVGGGSGLLHLFIPTETYFMQLCAALFEMGGGSGLLLKPPHLRSRPASDVTNLTNLGPLPPLPAPLPAPLAVYPPPTPTPARPPRVQLQRSGVSLVSLHGLPTRGERRPLRAAHEALVRITLYLPLHYTHEALVRT